MSIAREMTELSDAPDVVRLVRFAWKKDMSFRVPLFHPATSMRTRQMKEASVNAIGVKMHAILPALPIFVVAFACLFGEGKVGKKYCCEEKPLAMLC